MVDLQQIYIKVQYLGRPQADLLGVPGERMPPSGIKSGFVSSQPQDGTRAGYHLVRSVMRIYGMGAWRGSENLCENLCYGGLKGR